MNAALCLRRPLLVTGAPGSGKSTIIDSVAAGLRLGTPLRWHVTSQSTLSDALYRYDVLGRVHAHQLGGNTDDIAPFLQLGPLGTALLPATRPRALLIDEIDKSDLDLPSDLLNVLERGEYEIPELARHKDAEVRVQEWAGDRTHRTVRGRVQCTEFPFIVITNNGERDFPPPFLRRCVRFTMPSLSDTEMLKRVVRAHLGTVDSGPTLELINEFAARVGSDVVSLILSKPPDPGQDGGDEVLVGLRTGLPVIVWSRADCDSEEFQATVQELLHGDGPGTILQRLRQIRRAAYESHSEHIGRHLVMLWDDPERLVSPGDLGPPRDPREASIA